MKTRECGDGWKSAGVVRSYGQVATHELSDCVYTSAHLSRPLLLSIAVRLSRAPALHSLLYFSPSRRFFLVPGNPKTFLTIKLRLTLNNFMPHFCFVEYTSSFLLICSVEEMYDVKIYWHSTNIISLIPNMCALNT